uniref:Uncharacterized protein n=1 Tax=Oryza punctata TaxID=4537 RepID=A0A0E0M5K0_ORYPU
MAPTPHLASPQFPIGAELTQRLLSPTPEPMDFTPSEQFTLQRLRDQCYFLVTWYGENLAEVDFLRYQLVCSDSALSDLREKYEALCERCDGQVLWISELEHALAALPTAAGSPTIRPATPVVGLGLTSTTGTTLVFATALATTTTLVPIVTWSGVVLGAAPPPSLVQRASPTASPVEGLAALGSGTLGDVVRTTIPEEEPSLEEDPEERILEQMSLGREPELPKPGHLGKQLQQIDRNPPNYGEFMRTKPPTFTETVETLDAEDWLRTVEKMEPICADAGDKDRFAASLLEGTTND